VLATGAVALERFQRWCLASKNCVFPSR
jgi:hypothetical protein